MRPARFQPPTSPQEPFPCPKRPGAPQVTLAACLRYHQAGIDPDTPRTSPMARHCRECPLVLAARARTALPPPRASAPDTGPLPEQPKVVDPRQVCACCGETGRRMVPSRGLCISCYNRELEIKHGYDRRGNSLQGRSIAPIRVLTIDGQQIRRPSKSLLALTLWVLRSHPGAAISRGMPQGSPRSSALFPGMGGGSAAVVVRLHGG